MWHHSISVAIVRKGRGWHHRINVAIVRKGRGVAS